MKPGKSEIESYLIKSELALKNAREQADVFALVELHGYGEERLNAGWTLYKEAYRLVREQELCYGAQYEAGSAFKNARKQAATRFGELRRLARVALRGQTGMIKSLGLDEPPGMSLGTWLEHVRQFYNNALADSHIMNQLGRVGITPEKLHDALAMTDQTEKAAEAHEAAKGRAIKATKERDEAFVLFRRWMRDFRQVCRVALTDSPQLLEKLGIKA
jgi:hypothetical protein